MMDWGDGHMDAGWGVVMMVTMLAFWAFLAFAIAWFVRATRTPPAPPAPKPSSAEQILAERLARGEIEPEDYRARLSAMTAPR